MRREKIDGVSLFDRPWPDISLLGELIFVTFYT